MGGRLADVHAVDVYLEAYVQHVVHSEHCHGVVDVGALAGASEPSGRIDRFTRLRSASTVKYTYLYNLTRFHHFMRI